MNPPRKKDKDKGPWRRTGARAGALARSGVAGELRVEWIGQAVRYVGARRFTERLMR